MFIRFSIISALVLLFMGILFFEPITWLIKERSVLDLMVLFGVGVVSSLIGLVFIQGFELFKLRKSLSLGLYLLFSSGLSLVFLWGITLLWIQMLNLAISLRSASIYGYMVI